MFPNKLGAFAGGIFE